MDSRSAITRSYDDLNRTYAETTPQGSVSYVFDAASRRTSLTAAGQGSVNYAYDDASRLTAITQGPASVGLTYDAAGRRATLTLPSGITATYGYDDASQLTSITYQQGATTIGDLLYTYDLTGNRTNTTGSLAATNLPTATPTNTYNSANQLTSWNGATMTYDGNGNLLSDGTRTYTWDARHRLIGIAGPVNASFQYDAFDRRTQKTVAGASTNYLYDGTNIVQELSGTTPSANLLTGLNLDEVFRRTDTSSGARDFLTDALGTTLALADSSGAVQTSYSYEPYGNTTTAGQASTNPFQYTGRENDGTGLYYYRARYYSPTYQRFITSDPIGLSGGWNVYNYVGNSPLNFVDPYGLFELPSLPQGFVDATTGFGDGIYRVVTLGIGNLQDIRDVAGIDGDVNQCSSAYKWAHGTGQVAGGLALGGAGAQVLGRVTGPLEQWIRVGASYSKSLDKPISMSIRWGASPAGGGKYIEQIPSQALRDFNQWLRRQSAPFGGWRAADPGHFHLW